jgi:hypothetical protein
VRSGQATKGAESLPLFEMVDDVDLIAYLTIRTVLDAVASRPRVTTVAREIGR